MERGVLSLINWIPPNAQPVNGSHLQSIVGVHASMRDDATTAKSLGSYREGVGVVIDDHGLVLTIGYLIIESKSIGLVTNTNRIVEARFVGYDHETGFGLVRATEQLPGHPIPLGDSTAAAVGDEVTIASIPGEGAGPLQQARVVSVASFTGYWEYWLPRAIYVAPPHPAFGGAALLDGEGKLIGVGSILTRLDLEEQESLPANMFVPIELLKPILNELQTAGRPIRPPKPWLGLTLQDADDRGVLVLRVSAGGPSERAGLQPGDLIVAVEGEVVTELVAVYQAVWSRGPAGVEISLTIVRSGERLAIRVVSGNRYEYLKLGPENA
jgi:S1-C subfamily serine protease